MASAAAAVNAAPVFLHATALVVGEDGVLVEGAPGSGKSSLAAFLIGMMRRGGDFAALVGDDRVALEARGGRLLARPHPAIAGVLEHRGLGLLPEPHEPACRLTLAVRLAPAGDPDLLRLPLDGRTRILLGVSLPLVVLPAGAGPDVQALRVVTALRSGTPRI